MYWGQFKDSVCYLFLADAVISPARKRNLGQAYIFTSICHSVHWRGWLPSMHHRSYDQGRSAPRGVCIEGGLYRGGSASRGWWSTYRWICLQGGLHPGGGGLHIGGCASRGVCIQEVLHWGVGQTCLNVIFFVAEFREFSENI